MIQNNNCRKARPTSNRVIKVLMLGHFWLFDSFFLQQIWPALSKLDYSRHIFKTNRLFAVSLLLLLLFLQLLLPNSNISSANEPDYMWTARGEVEGDHWQVINTLWLRVCNTRRMGSGGSRVSWRSSGLPAKLIIRLEKKKIK